MIHRPEGAKFLTVKSSHGHPFLTHLSSYHSQDEWRGTIFVYNIDQFPSLDTFQNDPGQGNVTIPRGDVQDAVAGLISPVEKVIVDLKTGCVVVLLLVTFAYHFVKLHWQFVAGRFELKPWTTTVHLIYHKVPSINVHKAKWGSTPVIKVKCYLVQFSELTKLEIYTINMNFKPDHFV